MFITTNKTRVYEKYILPLQQINNLKSLEI